MVHIFLFFCKFEAKSVELIIIIELSFKNLNLNQKFFKKGHIGAKINLVFGNNNPKCATLKKVITFNFSVCFDFFKVNLDNISVTRYFKCVSNQNFPINPNFNPAFMITLFWWSTKYFLNQLTSKTNFLRWY